jgi:[acyl-carrier-protein] S-malonyltransferase
VLEREGGFKVADKLAFVAGHSLGEYSALAAAGALGLAEAARLLKLRGQAMQKAVPVGEGAMAALLGVDLSVAQDVAASAATDTGEVCTTANDNAPGQVVLSGSKKAIDRAVVIAPETGAKRALLLTVSAPFHCPLMQPAADEMAEALAEAKIAAPIVPLIANVTARHVSDPETIRSLLVKQVTGMVRWRESVAYMKEQGVDRITEIGAGKVLAGLVKRIDKEIEASSVGEPADIEALLKVL